MKWRNHFYLICAFSLFPYLSVRCNDVNVALHKPVTASSEQVRFPAANVTDGVISRKSAWISGEIARPPYWLEIDLQKYYDINQIIVYTGIPEAEKKQTEKGQAPGFWSVKNLRIQYWDDANWTDLPETELSENRLDKVIFTFKPLLSTFRLRLVSTDGEPIRVNEMEVYGSEKKNMPEPANVSGKINAGAQYVKDVRVSVTKEVIGKTMKYVGYNQGYYFPGSNISGWLEYSGVNSLRVWTSIEDFVHPEYILVDKELSSPEQFEKNKLELRNSPENNRFIKWDKILEECRKEKMSANSMVLEYALKELKRLGIDVVLQMNSTNFNDSWSNKWQQWQSYYALAFYAAKTGDVTMFAMQNEPNHRYSGPMKISQYVDGMRIVSDAVHCAVEDVDKLYGKNLATRFVSPVTAGSNAGWWAEVIKNVRTDYRGFPSQRDLIDIFSTHSYNLPAAGYVSKVSDIRKILVENHPAKQSLPIVFTETGRWMNAYLIDKKETMDSPSLFTEWAGEYTNNTLNQGYGMWAFKFANTVSNTYPRGIKSGHHLIWQGKRIVEDAYTNLALGKKVTDRTYSSHPVVTKDVTDGNKTDQSAWISPETDFEKCLEIDLRKPCSIGGAVVYTGSGYGVFTGPDRVKTFRLQYLEGKVWTDIKETIQEEAKYVQSFFIFEKPVTASRFRLIAKDKGIISIREIKLFDAVSMKDIPVSYDVSGIQRTGEVVRLFAEGFKNELPLLHTVKSVPDHDLDVMASFNPATMTYYVWLVQRKTLPNNLTLDLKMLNLPPSSKVMAEEVGTNVYGEVVWVKTPTDGTLSFELPAQSVMLLTIPVNQIRKPLDLVAVADAAVRSGKNSRNNFGQEKVMNVEMNASRTDNNQVSYMKFDLSGVDREKINAAVLNIFGKSSGTPYRLHVYALNGGNWDEHQITWNTAPNLETKEVRIKDVGRSAHVAGEIVFDMAADYHQLDVTSIIRKSPDPVMTFVMIREIRQLGDDVDNNKKCTLGTKESDQKPFLSLW